MVPESVRRRYSTMFVGELPFGPEDRSLHPRSEGDAPHQFLPTPPGWCYTEHHYQGLPPTPTRRKTTSDVRPSTPPREPLQPAARMSQTGKDEEEHVEKTADLRAEDAVPALWSSPKLSPIDLERPEWLHNDGRAMPILAEVANAETPRPEDVHEEDEMDHGEVVSRWSDTMSSLSLESDHEHAQTEPERDEVITPVTERGPPEHYAFQRCPHCNALVNLQHVDSGSGERKQMDGLDGSAACECVQMSPQARGQIREVSYGAWL